MRKFILSAIAMAFFALPGAARADEQKVTFDKVPKPVMETVNKRFPKAEQLEATKVTTGDKVVYDITIKVIPNIIDVTVTPEGVLQSFEKEIPVKDLPKPVTVAIEAKFPKSVIDIAAEFVLVKNGKESLAYYQIVAILADKRAFAAEVLPSGQILKTEDKSNLKD